MGVNRCGREGYSLRHHMPVSTCKTEASGDPELDLHLGTSTSQRKRAVRVVYRERRPPAVPGRVAVHAAPPSATSAARWEHPHRLAGRRSVRGRCPDRLGRLPDRPPGDHGRRVSRGAASRNRPRRRTTLDPPHGIGRHHDRLNAPPGHLDRCPDDAAHHGPQKAPRRSGATAMGRPRMSLENAMNRAGRPASMIVACLLGHAATPPSTPGQGLVPATGGRAPATGVILPAGAVQPAATPTRRVSVDERSHWSSRTISASAPNATARRSSTWWWPTPARSGCRTCRSTCCGTTP